MSETGADVIVIGGGIVGCSTALHLAKAGRSVILLERDQAGIRASGVNFGGVRQHGRALAEIPLSFRSRAIWADLDKLIGTDGEFAVTGHLRLARKEADVTLLLQHLQAVAEYGLQLEFLDRANIDRRFPWLGPSVIAATHCPSDGQANPRLISPAFAAAARKAGATLVEGVEVVEGTHDGASFHVSTRDRRGFAAPVLVNAAGAWASAIAGWFGEHVALKPEVPQVMVTEPAPYRFQPVLGVVGGDLYFRQIPRGNVIFGGGEGRAEPGHKRSRPLPEISARAAAEACRIVPEIRNLAIIRTWTGVDGDTADGSPAIGPSTTTPGLFHAFGFCGHGFQLGPGTGAVLAELIVQGTSDTDIHGLGIARLLGRG
ncbi:MAG TPA: FAD-binding oxidoreductase [Candidatus Cybelea sp.]|nr:FAD-binding oxidoreductase [Candidatus Cybelea sp.]